LVAQTASTAGPSHEALTAAVDSIAAAVLEESGVPSASVAVVRQARTEYLKAYGTARLVPRTAASTDMRYAIGSISKQFTAAAVLLLQQEGELSLDDPVAKWYPELTRADDITLRNLLTHTSGYSDFWPHDYVPTMMQTAIDPDSVIARWAGAPLDFEPGTKWEYSNTNFVLAGRIVEKITGMPLFSFLEERVFEPLGMGSVVNFDQGRMTDADPAGYRRFGLGPLRPALPEGAGWMLGAAELAMTPADLARWDVSLMRESLLAPASYRQMERDMLLADGLPTGYGLAVDVASMSGHRLIAHSGEVSGFVSYNYVFPDDSAAVVVLTNQMAAPAAGAIARAVARVMFTAPDPLTEARTARARSILEGFQHGTIDRSLFTRTANEYFTEQGLKDLQEGLAPLGAPLSFVQTSSSDRGGMIMRNYRVRFQDRTLRVWTFEWPDGSIEQYQIAPQL
ncbi:MAG: serine hydrolase domain-containing protein, partial [Gemmatimonadota bacterium]